jgi:hypothetical protein
MIGGNQLEGHCSNSGKKWCQAVPELILSQWKNVEKRGTGETLRA